MLRTLTLLAALMLMSLGCSTYKYVKKPWAEVSLEQAEAQCEMEAQKTAAKGGEHVNKYSIKSACMKAKGWEMMREQK